jgi:hypothetical protein
MCRFAGLLILSMLGVASSLLLTNNGLEAPGLALSVEPMVEIPPNTATHIAAVLS